MRVVGAVLAIAVLGIGFVMGKKLDADAFEQNRQRTADRAEKASADAAAALEKQLALFQVKAQGVASNPVLHNLVRGGATDEATYHDSLNDEAWSQPYRERGGSVAVYFEGRKAGSSPSLVPGATLEELAKGAQQNGDSSGFSAHDGVFLVAGARLPFDAANGEKVSVVVTRPLTQDELDALGPGALLISDGQRKLASHGDVGALPAAVLSRASEGRVDVEGAMAHARKLGGLWVWALEPMQTAAAPLVPKGAVWGGAAVLAVAVLALTLRPRKAAPPPPLPLTSSNIATELEIAAYDRTRPSMSKQNRYLEVAPLGEGGMAKVSLAVTHGAEGFRRQFVVKRLKSELTTNPEVVAQFIDEARLGASLVHSNVIPVFDFGHDEEGYFMAQEYIMGRDLDAVRRALFEQHRATLDPSLVLYVAQEALKALSYAHGKTDDQGQPMGLVHRDVSPNNLMVSARGEVKLLDFGIVKATAKLSQTQAGMIKGNVFYMSPEQARGLPVDPRADLFSLGLVLFTLCSGETLYRGNSNYDLLTRAGEGLSNAELDRVRRLPGPVASLLLRVLALDPAARFQSAEEFMRAIDPAQIGSSSKLQSLMEVLFAADFAKERARFSKA